MKVDTEKVLIENGGYCLHKSEDFYIHHHWKKGFSIMLDKDEMKEFLEIMTDEENQKKMKEELGFIRFINDVEKQMKESVQ